jgi:hypothetical protein
MRAPGEPSAACRPRSWLEEKLGTLADFELERSAASIAHVANTPELVLAAGPAMTGPPVPSYPVGIPASDLVIPAAVRDYTGGILPSPARKWSRDQRRAADLSQEEVARRIGLSRPRLANVEAGRFGLSPDAAARFVAPL